MEHYLTRDQLQLVTNPDFIINKNKIIAKVYALFGDLSEEYKDIVELSPLQSLSIINAKIAKGENYLGFPYVILDYPRLFSRTNVFAIRSFFWWGNFFSITLHLAGDYYKDYYPLIKNAVDNNLLEGWFINASKEQWEHHFEMNNYQSISSVENSTSESKSFVKLAKKIPLQEWDSSTDFFIENFKTIARILTDYAPMR